MVSSFLRLEHRVPNVGGREVAGEVVESRSKDSYHPGLDVSGRFEVRTVLISLLQPRLKFNLL